MRKAVRFFVDNALFGDVLTVAIIALGVASLFQIRREIFPNVNFDVISVDTVFPAASPEEVEKLVTNAIEQELQEVDGIKKLQSYSRDGLSRILVYVDPDRTTSDKAKSDIQNVIDRLTDLPEAAEDTVVTSLESKQGPVIEVSVAGELPELELRRAAKRLEKEIESVPGVARVSFLGLRKLEYKVDADLRKLAEYRLSLDDLVIALKAQNVSIPGGIVEVSDGGGKGRERVVRTSTDFERVEDVRDTVIRANDLGRPIRVGDVARVYEGQERAIVMSRTNGKPSISLTVLQKEKTDAIDMVDAVKERVDSVRPTLDPRIEVDFINDFSDFIRRRLQIVTGNLLVGLCLVLLLLPLMIPFRFAMIIALGEPFAFLGTILLLYWTGNSINLISMIGLIIVSGILVDDSIVVTENAVRMVQAGKSPREAAIKGTMQIMPPLVASVLTTSAAFLPMAFMSGIFGKFVREIPIAVLTALAVSLFETFFILPAHVAHWIKAKQFVATEAVTKVRKWYSPGMLKRLTAWTQAAWDERVVPAYVRLLEKILRKRYWVLAGLGIFFFGSIGLATQVMRFVLFPPEGVEIFFVQAEAPSGTSLERTAELLKTVERKVAELPPQELQDYTTVVGLVQQEPNDPNTQRGAEFGQVVVILTPETARERKAQQIMDGLRESVGQVPGLDRISFARVNTGPPVGKPVSLGVRGTEFEDILVVVRELEARLQKLPGVFDVRNSYHLGKEELLVRVNGPEAAAAGLSTLAIGSTVRAAFEGTVATSIRKLDEEIDVRVSLPRADRASEESFRGLLIPNPMGNLVPLGSVARIDRGQGLSEIRHEAAMRQVVVTADVDVDKTSALEANGSAREWISELSRLKPGVSVAFGGEDEDTQESFASLGRAFLIALIGIFLILILTFKNLFQPLIVLITIPLGVISVIWAFFLHGLPLSFMGMLGIVALAGVIVNNAIVFVDFVNQARKDGMDERMSIVEAARTRIRPIFLTTITTTIGILPAAYGIGGLDMFVVPIALALGWGIFFGSVLTALVFPAALAVLDDARSFGRRSWRRTS